MVGDETERLTRSLDDSSLGQIPRRCCGPGLVGGREGRGDIAERIHPHRIALPQDE